MSSSSTSNFRGASEHNAENEWNGALAFSDIGLAGGCFEGGKYDSFAQKHAWAHTELLSCIHQVLPDLQSSIELARQELGGLLQALLTCREPAVFIEGKVLSYLWSLPNTADLRELEKKLRILVVRRAQCMLYNYLSLHHESDFRKRRKMFLDFCCQQLRASEINTSKSNVLLLSYRKEFGNTVEGACTSCCIDAHLFPSAAEIKTIRWTRVSDSCAWVRHSIKSIKPPAKKKIPRQDAETSGVAFNVTQSTPHAGFLHADYSTQQDDAVSHADYSTQQDAGCSIS